MQYDEFEIVIKKTGEIAVKLDDMEEKTVRHYREILEEAIGPVRENVEISGEGSPPGAVRLTETEKKEESQERRDKLHH